MSENQQRNMYARMFAAVLAAEALGEHPYRDRNSRFRVEAEDHPIWDDIVHDHQDGYDKYQVKRQQTDLSSDDFRQLLQAVDVANSTTYHFVVPVLVSVENAGELRVLGTLLARLQQIGSSEERILSNLRDAERTWIDFVRETFSGDERCALECMKRIRVDVVGFEAELTTRGIRALVPLYRELARDAWDRTLALMMSTDGAVEVTPTMLAEILPVAQAKPEHRLYLAFVREVEVAFQFDSWEWLSDNCVRCLLPMEFVDALLALQHAVRTTAWPGVVPGFEKTLLGLVEAGIDYVEFFRSRCEVRGEFLREDLSYKRVFPNPRFLEEAQEARNWDEGCIRRFVRVVIALNRFVKVVRDVLDPTYRLRSGVFAIYDFLGVRGDGSKGTFMIPDEEQ